MGDFGNSSASGGSSLSGADLNNLFSDASLGDQLTGGSSDIFGASSSQDLSNLFADAGMNLLGDSSGLGGAFSTVTDPSGAAAASLSTTPPADQSGTPAGSDPSGNIGGTQSGGAPQPGQPSQPARPVTPTPQDQSPLGRLANMVKSSFGLGEQPAAGGPTGFTDAQKLALPGAAVETVAPGGAAAVAAPLAGAGFLLPFMTRPTQAATGVELPRTLGRSPSGPPSGPENDLDSPEMIKRANEVMAEPNIPTSGPENDLDSPEMIKRANEVMAEPNIPIGGGAGNVQEAPTGTPAQPPAAAAQPVPAPAAAPAAPAAATPDLPTRKEPATPEAAPGPSEGLGGPTGGMGGIGEILRDVLGLALANPTLLPMLAQAFIGGRGRGRGVPPWAMHGMMPFMRGRGRGFGGFRGGFLRPGYYPRRQGGWGFHPGGYHPGWGAWAPGVMGNQPMAFAGGAAGAAAANEAGGWRGANVQSGGIPNSDAGDAGSTDANGVAHSSSPFISKLLGLESGGRNIVSTTDKDDAGRTLAQGGNPNQISQGYFQIRPSTWRAYARQAGVDPNMLPRQASYADQWKVAQVIPFAQWGGRTRLALGLGNIDRQTTLGQVASRYGGTRLASGGAAPSSTTSRQPSFRIRDSNPDPLTSHAYPAPTETTGEPAPVQSDDFASAG